MFRKQLTEFAFCSEHRNSIFFLFTYTFIHSLIKYFLKALCIKKFERPASLIGSTKNKFNMHFKTKMLGFFVINIQNGSINTDFAIEPGFKLPIEIALSINVV